MSIPTTSSRWSCGLAYAAALIFTLASAGTNLAYGWSRGTDFPSSVIWAAVSVAASIVFALSWPALVGSIERRNWSRAGMAFLALLLTGSYSVTAALGSAMGGRADAERSEQATADARTRAQEAYAAAKSDLAKLASSRSVPEVDAAIAGARPHCRVVVTTGTRKTVCATPPALLAELARAQQRGKLEVALASAASDLTKIGAARAANTDAAALVAYLGAVGVETTTDRLNKLLVVLAVLLVEMGGGLALAVGMSLRTTSVPVAGAPVARVRLPVERIAAPSPAAVRLLEFVREHGGRVATSQRALGKELGVSRTRVGVVLRQLQSGGLISFDANTTGTNILAS